MLQLALDASCPLLFSCLGSSSQQQVQPIGLADGGVQVPLRIFRAIAWGCCAATAFTALLSMLVLLGTAAAACAGAVLGICCGVVGAGQRCHLDRRAVMTRKPQVCGVAGAKGRCPVRWLLQQQHVAQGAAAAATQRCI